MGGNIEAHLDDSVPGVATVGLRAGLFHPLTGYSLPDAAALADHISALSDLSGPALADFTRSYAVKTWYNRGFYRMLSRFLFDAARPEERYVVMQRFYKLNRGLVERFYAARSMPHDKLRVLCGKPPVNFFRALACINESQWTARTKHA
ncbi:MAG: lycopene cyclase family protein, partial [Pseudomonadota bacterium]